MTRAAFSPPQAAETFIPCGKTRESFSPCLPSHCRFLARVQEWGSDTTTFPTLLLFGRSMVSRSHGEKQERIVDELRCA